MTDYPAVPNVTLAELLSALLDDTTEPQGILSRLERHIIHIRDAQNDIANHDAQIGAARYEFSRTAFAAFKEQLDRIEARLDALESALVIKVPAPATHRRNQDGL